MDRGCFLWLALQMVATWMRWELATITMVIGVIAYVITYLTDQTQGL